MGNHTSMCAVSVYITLLFRKWPEVRIFCIWTENFTRALGPLNNFRCAFLKKQDCKFTTLKIPQWLVFQPRGIRPCPCGTSQITLLHKYCSYKSLQNQSKIFRCLLCSHVKRQFILIMLYCICIGCCWRGRAKLNLKKKNVYNSEIIMTYKIFYWQIMEQNKKYYNQDFQKMFPRSSKYTRKKSWVIPRAGHEVFQLHATKYMYFASMELNYIWEKSRLFQLNWIQLQITCM